MVRKKKNKQTKKTSSQIQQDMELFAKGVERLKELKQELSSLDTKGFAKEEQSIKSKLKNVSDVPIIEREMKTLRLKIDKKYKPKKRKRVSKIGKAIRELKEGLEKKDRQKLIKNVGDLKNEIANKKGKALKEDFEDLRDTEIRKGRALKEDIEELKEDVGKVSGLKLEVRKLREEIEKKKKRRVPRRRAIKIDTEVGFLVEKDFDGFVKDIERKLSERVSEKEESFDNVLKRDLEKRQKNFVLKYETLISRFNRKKERLEKEMKDKYNLQVETSLKKEVDEKFNQKLNNKLHDEKSKLIEEYQKLLRENVKQQVEQQKNNLRKKFDGEFANKLKLLQVDFANKLKLLQSEFAKKVGSVQKEEETEMSLLKKQEQQNIDKQKRLEEEKEKLKEKEKKLDVLKKKLIEESHKKLEAELFKKQKILEVRMRNNFKLKLDKHIQEHDALLKKKKLGLELEMAKKIKQMLD